MIVKDYEYIFVNHLWLNCFSSYYLQNAKIRNIKSHKNNCVVKFINSLLFYTVLFVNPINKMSFTISIRKDF